MDRCNVSNTLPVARIVEKGFHYINQAHLIKDVSHVEPPGMYDINKSKITSRAKILAMTSFEAVELVQKE